MRFSLGEDTRTAMSPAEPVMSPVVPWSGPFLSLWRHRELYRRVLTRDILSAFRGSMLGLAWVVVIPLVLVAIYTFVFGVVVQSTWAIKPKTPFEVPLIYFASLMVFGFFMEVVTRAPNHIRDNKTYVTKIIFPLEILSWVLVGTALFKFCINLCLLTLALLLVTGGVSPKLLLLPALMVPFALMTLGIAWILSAVGAYIRDLSLALQALGPIIMFVSPIFYSVEQVPEQLRTVYFLNPLTFMLESTRGILFFDQAFSLRGYVGYSLAAVLVFSIGYVFFQRLRPGFADVV
jgi:lipopolysaccharide transport system permease protein